MSVVVVVKKGGKAVIAADTLYGFGTTNVKSSYLQNRTKIHRFGDSFIGTVGPTAHENVLEHLLVKHKDKLNFDSVNHIFGTYLRIHPILKDEYFLQTGEGENDEEYESSQIDGLIANPNGIFGMYTWREVYEFEKFWALGSGKNYALGALFTVYDMFDDAEQIAEAAVEAACEFDEACGLPATLHSVTLNEKSTRKNGKPERKTTK